MLGDSVLGTLYMLEDVKQRVIVDSKLFMDTNTRREFFIAWKMLMNQEKNRLFSPTEKKPLHQEIPGARKIVFIFKASKIQKLLSRAYNEFFMQVPFLHGHSPIIFIWPDLDILIYTHLA